MTARALLISGGREAVTLRAIARELGITAPALYRYHDSREDLLRQICDDICTDLAGELRPAIDAVPEQDMVGQVFAVCRAFRRWALGHPQEFALVFASPPEVSTGCGEDALKPAKDQFGRVFLEVTGRLLSEHTMEPTMEAPIPESLRADLDIYRKDLLDSLYGAGVALPADRLSQSTVYFILQWWVRLYGHIALEVFGRFPFAVASAEPLFESMLNDMVREINIA